MSRWARSAEVLLRKVSDPKIGNDRLATVRAALMAAYTLGRREVLEDTAAEDQAVFLARRK